MTITFAPALSHTLEEIAGTMTHGFAGYYVDIQFSAAVIADLVRRDSVDLATSQLVLRDDEVVGGAFMARRGWTSRIAAMGIVPEARSQGIGRRLVEHLVAEARARGEREMWLEVIEGNTPAVTLYRNFGFTPVRRLVGYSAEHPRATIEAAPEEIDIRQAGRMLSMQAPTDLPWQISGETVAQYGPPARGYRLGPAHIVISDTNQPVILIHGLIVAADSQQTEWATRLMRTLIAMFPKRTWRVPPYFPEDMVAPIFDRLGFERESISQMQMRLTL